MCYEAYNVNLYSYYKYNFDINIIRKLNGT